MFLLNFLFQSFFSLFLLLLVFFFKPIFVKLSGILFHNISGLLIYLLYSEYFLLFLNPLSLLFNDLVQSIRVVNRFLHLHLWLRLHLKFVKSLLCRLIDDF